MGRGGETRCEVEKGPRGDSGGPFHWQHWDGVWSFSRVVRRSCQVQHDIRVGSMRNSGMANNDELPATRPSSVTEVWHYTTLEAAIGILETNELWASDVRFMNDPSEFRFAIEQFLEYLQRRGLPNDAFKESLLRNLNWLNPFDGQHAMPIICSFSAEPDDLTQWRSYSDDGSGVAFVFDVESLRESVRACGGDWHECRYIDRISHPSETSELERAFENILWELQNVWQRDDVRTEEDAGDRESLVRHEIRTGTLARDIIPVLKPDGFRGEKERRAVFLGMFAKPKLRYRNGRLVPCQPMPLSERGAKVTRVVVGPAASDDLIEAALVQYMNSRSPDPNDPSRLIITARVERSRHRYRR